MARKNIFDIVSKSQIEPWRMYQRVYNLFYCNDVRSPEFGYTTVCDEVDRAFRYFPYTFRHGAITLEDFNHTYNYSFSEYVTEEESYEELLRLCEYVVNMCVQLDKRMIKNDSKYNDVLAQMDYICNHAYHYMDELGFEVIKKEEYFIIVEKSPAAEAVAEIVDDDLSYKVLEYNHFRLKGDLEAKKSILKLMADDIELQRKQLKGINGNLDSQLFQMLNKFIRHNNSDEEFLKLMTDEELEGWYDETYQLWLLAKLELDNLERKKRIAKLLATING